jgi:ElaB/YqjD/DUF883 family membrane-anchored ribosome-binding protein
MSSRHAAELRALHDTLRAASAREGAAVPRALAAAPADVEPAKEESELITVLRELKDGLVAAADNADEIIVAHPVASVGAAFLLGLAVGRLMRGL